MSTSDAAAATSRAEPNPGGEQVACACSAPPQRSIRAASYAQDVLRSAVIDLGDSELVSAQPLSA